MQRALIVIDMQRGFDDETIWGRMSNPACEQNVQALIDAFTGAGEPVVVVRQSRATRSSRRWPRSRPRCW